MKQRFSRTHRRPVARGKVNELGRHVDTGEARERAAATLERN